MNLFRGKIITFFEILITLTKFVQYILFYTTVIRKGNGNAPFLPSSRKSRLLISQNTLFASRYSIFFIKMIKNSHHTPKNRR
jgi:hypothetical protein